MIENTRLIYSASIHNSFLFTTLERMIINKDKYSLISRIWLTVLFAVVMAVLLGHKSTAQSAWKSYHVLVNSDRDYPIQPDEELTLREAIALANNNLSYGELSLAEQKQVKIVNRPYASRIEFDFSAPVKIELQEILPPLISPDLVIDGTTHPDYDPNNSATAEISIPIPVVSLTVAKGKNVLRGLTIASDRITVKGLSIYGFGQSYYSTDATPGADIVISSRLPITEEQLPHRLANPPQDVEIIDNWLGLPPDESVDKITSNFGVWLFDGINTEIQRNRIYYHGGSGILTSVNAQNAQIKSNIIVGNGLQGMPHAIYLEGLITSSKIVDNLICGNDGSAVYLFKPDGATSINNNRIKFNGRRVSSAAIYLIGNDHQVTNNHISWQTGPGVTVAAYPQSDRNLITNNSFANLEGLSIDLNTRNRVNNPFFKLGDGVNPLRNSSNRRRDTANKAINAPQFLSEDFYLIDGKVNIDGIADSGSTVTLYQVLVDVPRTNKPQNRLTYQTKNHGPLTKILAETKVDNKGRFGFTLDNLTPGTIISAISTKPQDGTSEPALNATIKSINNQKNSVQTRHASLGALSLLPRLVWGASFADAVQQSVGRVPQVAHCGGSPRCSDYRRLEGTAEPFRGSFIPLSLGHRLSLRTPNSELERNKSLPTCTTKPIAKAIKIDKLPTPVDTEQLKVPRNLHFAFDRANISEPTAAIFDRIVAILKQYPFLVIELQGHTDPRGNAQYNLSLSSRRANAARNYLLKQGVRPERITIRSFGESQLKKPGISILEHAQNRRVEIFFYDIRALDIIFEEQENDLQLEQ